MSFFNRVAKAAEDQAVQQKRLADTLEKLTNASSADEVSPIGFHVSAIQGRIRPMPPIIKPPLTLSDVEFDILSWLPAVDKDGRPIAGATHVVTLTDQAASDGSGADVASLTEFDDTAHTVKCNTGAPGTVNAHNVRTLPSGQVDEEIIPITVTFSAPGEIGFSAGVPQPETP